MNRFFALTCLPLVFGAVACGSLASDKDPVLATVHGELTTTDSLQTPTDTRVAVVWLGFAHGYSVAEDLQVQPVFPSQFKLELTHVPPAEAMVNKANQQAQSNNAEPPSQPPSDQPPSPSGGSGGTGTGQPLGASGGGAAGTRGASAGIQVSQWADDFGFAIGAVVAYEDLNHNGKLDLVDEGATAYVDRVLGANPSTILVYFEGTIPNDFVDEDGHLPTQGYNLFHIASCPVGEVTNGTFQDSDGGSASSTPACTDRTQWLSIDTLYTLPLTGDPKFSDIMCKSGGSFTPGGGGSSSSGGGAATSNGDSSGPSSASGGANGTDPDQPGQATDGGLPTDDAGTQQPSYPSPSDPELQCAADGRSYTYGCPVPQQPRLCGDNGEVAIYCAPVELPSGPVPADWPCPVH